MAFRSTNRRSPGYELGYAHTLRELFQHGYAHAKKHLADNRERLIAKHGADWHEGATRALINGTLGNPRHVWTNTACGAYRTHRGRDCTC